MVRRSLSGERRSRKGSFPSKMVKGKRKTTPSLSFRRSNSSSSIGTDSDILPSSPTEGPKASKDSRLDDCLLNNKVETTGVKPVKGAAKSASEAAATSAMTMVNGVVKGVSSRKRDMITNYFSPNRSPVTADDADMTETTSDADHAVSMMVKSARLDRTNSIDASSSAAITDINAAITAAADDSSTTVAAPSNNKPQENTKHYWNSGGGRDISTTSSNCLPYGTKLQPHQQHKQKQQQQYNNVTTALTDDAIGSSTAAKKAYGVAATITVAPQSKEKPIGCVTNNVADCVVSADASDTDDDCVVIEDDDDASDDYVPSLAGSNNTKETNNFSGFPASSISESCSFRTRSQQLLKQSTARTKCCAASSTLPAGASAADFASAACSFPNTFNSSNRSCNNIHHNRIQHYSCCSSSSSNSGDGSSCSNSSCGSSIISSCNSSDNIVVVGDRVDGSCDICCDVIDSNDKKLTETDSIWKSPRKHPSSLAAAAAAAKFVDKTDGVMPAVANGLIVVNGQPCNALDNLYSLVNQKRSSMKMSAEDSSEEKQQPSMSSYDITTRGLRKSPNKSSKISHNYDSYSSSSNIAKSASCRSNCLLPSQSPSKKLTSNNSSPIVVDLTSDNYGSDSTTQAKLSHSSPIVRKLFSSDVSTTINSNSNMVCHNNPNASIAENIHQQKLNFSPEIQQQIISEINKDNDKNVESPRSFQSPSFGLNHSGSSGGPLSPGNAFSAAAASFSPNSFLCAAGKGTSFTYSTASNNICSPPQSNFAACAANPGTANHFSPSNNVAFSATPPTLSPTTTVQQPPSSPCTPSTPHKIQVIEEEEPAANQFMSPSSMDAISRLSMASPISKQPVDASVMGRGRPRGRGKRRLMVQSVDLSSALTKESSSDATSSSSELSSSSATITRNNYLATRSRTRSPVKQNVLLSSSPPPQQQHQSSGSSSSYSLRRNKKNTASAAGETATDEKINKDVKKLLANISSVEPPNGIIKTNVVTRQKNGKSNNMQVNSTVLSKTSINNKATRTKAAATRSATNTKSLSSNSADVNRNSQMTDYFPIRRSERKPKATLLHEKQMDIEKKILEGSEDGLRVEEFGAKGRGVVTTRRFLKGEFVVEYVGELLDIKDAKTRETNYAMDTSKGCYMYYFIVNDVQYCIDGTEESGYLGRLVNHSRTANNLVTKSVCVDGRPHLILVAKKEIVAGIELLYDYGDRSKEALANHPWLAY